LQRIRRSKRLAPPTDRVTQGVARRRGASRVPQMCPQCVRVFNGQTTTKCRFAGTLGKPSDGLEPSTPSLPWRFLGVTRVHARSLATHILLQIGLLLPLGMRSKASRVSFLMCPFCVRGSLSVLTTRTYGVDATDHDHEFLPIRAVVQVTSPGWTSREWARPGLDMLSRPPPTSGAGRHPARPGWL
jgi:hypothetical protein